MTTRLLTPDPAFDPATQATVACLTAGLDCQLDKLKESVAGLSVEALEWQSAPGMNSIGILLAHLALVEVFWISAFPERPGPWAAHEPTYREVLGLRGDEDGIPLPADGAHPEALRGRSLDDYLVLLDKARARIRSDLHTWTDEGLDTIHELDDLTVSRRWILYHVLEHFAGHLGQVLLIRHQLRDAGLVDGGD